MQDTTHILSTTTQGGLDITLEGVTVVWEGSGRTTEVLLLNSIAYKNGYTVAIGSIIVPHVAGHSYQKVETDIAILKESQIVTVELIKQTTPMKLSRQYESLKEVVYVLAEHYRDHGSPDANRIADDYLLLVTVIEELRMTLVETLLTYDRVIEEPWATVTHRSHIPAPFNYYECDREEGMHAFDYDVVDGIPMMGEITGDAFTNYFYYRDEVGVNFYGSITGGGGGSTKVIMPKTIIFVQLERILGIIDPVEQGGEGETWVRWIIYVPGTWNVWVGTENFHTTSSTVDVIIEALGDPTWFGDTDWARLNTCT